MDMSVGRGMKMEPNGRDPSSWIHLVGLLIWSGYKLSELADDGHGG